MAKIKLALEIEENLYNQLKKHYEEIGKKMHFISVEDYILFIITSFLHSSEQFKNMSQNFGNLFSMFDGTNVDLSEIIKKYKSKNETKQESSDDNQKKKDNLKN
ncbi:MAG: hypothetical protein LBT77_01910 [Mycoplasmataceae bacterium]|jgi:hypothetical protein|nr:hypothetical protein [Mycoplasmataceae bacterium]